MIDNSMIHNDSIHHHQHHHLHLNDFSRANLGKPVVKLVHYLYLFCAESLGTGTGIFYRCPSRQPADSIKALISASENHARAD